MKSLFGLILVFSGVSAFGANLSSQDCHPFLHKAVNEKADKVIAEIAEALRGERTGAISCITIRERPEDGTALLLFSQPVKSVEYRTIAVTVSMGVQYDAKGEPIKVTNPYLKWVQF